MTVSSATTLSDVLDAWQQAIAAHDFTGVAALFSEDAVFQGLHPYSVGRQGVADYYAAQPLGMTVDYRIVEARQLADDVTLGWIAADFSFVEDRPPASVSLTVVVRNGLVAHYHVSPRIDAA
ncbi:nuclear transport factor 2 family protein [Actinoplanes sp. HUAS TT8]|uniref:nuclear transport factor 2 family protein n=1 Tax=Actinoplanes sp. HUAS TT8 TaxID=3447453 RepID=UPI003F523A93